MSVVYISALRNCKTGKECTPFWPAMRMKMSVRGGQTTWGKKFGGGPTFCTICWDPIDTGEVYIYSAMDRYCAGCVELEE